MMMLSVIIARGKKKMCKCAKKMADSVGRVMSWKDGEFEIPKMGLDFKFTPRKGYRRKSMVGFKYCPWCGRRL